MLKRLVCVLVALLMIPVSAFAHAGRTDSSGGHTDRETGDYHYHHGYEAHYHTGGVCPFEFDDKTGWNSGEPSDSSGSSGQETPDVEWVQIADGWWHNPELDQWKDSEGNIYTGIEYYEALGYTYHEDIGIWTGADGIINEDGVFQSYDDLASEFESNAGEHELPAEETEPEELANDSELSFFEIAAIVLAVIFFVIYPVGYLVFALVEEYKEKKAAKLRFKEEQMHFLSLYEGKTKDEIARMCGMPDMVWIGKGDLPRGLSLWHWGDEFTFFVSKTGQAFHSSASCNRQATIPCHAVHLGTRTPCTRCRPERPDLTWYYAYRDAMRNIEKYKVTLSEAE